MGFQAAEGVTGEGQKTPKDCQGNHSHPQQGDVDHPLVPDPHARDHPGGIGIAHGEKYLEEKLNGGPNHRGPAEEGQDEARDHGLDLEE